ncbi:hypothetical protein MTO96_014771 [Rhipicephalus appendiculatus]
MTTAFYNAHVQAHNISPEMPKRKRGEDACTTPERTRREPPDLVDMQDVQSRRTGLSLDYMEALHASFATGCVTSRTTLPPGMASS